MHHFRQVNINNLCPEIARDINLCRSAQADSLRNHSVQYLCDTRWVTNFFLVGDHILEQCHLFHFLKAALADGFISCLRGNQQ